ncbi:hypothetical protein D3C86_1573650 [compost metagenome]
MAIDATATTADVVKMASAIANLPPSGVPISPSSVPTPRISSDTRITAMMPMPEIGLADEPTSPAI